MAISAAREPVFLMVMSAAAMEPMAIRRHVAVVPRLSAGSRQLSVAPTISPRV